MAKYRFLADVRVPEEFVPVVPPGITCDVRMFPGVHFKGPFVNIWGHPRIGEGTEIGGMVEIGDAVIIGQRCKIGAYTFIPPGVTIGDDVFVGPGVRFANDLHPPSPQPEWRQTVVGNGAVIGIGAIILPGVGIDPGAKIGAGAVVTTDVTIGEWWVGNPARPISQRNGPSVGLGSA